MEMNRRQDRERLLSWREELARQVYCPVGTVRFEGFVTRERLTPAQAEAQPMRPFSPGTAWGACWEYGWFKGDAVLPPEAEGRRVLVDTGLGGEQLVYVNGHAAGALDRHHPAVPLTPQAKAGEIFHLLVESYAGHGARLEGLGPCPPERPALPPVPAAQCTVREGVLLAVDEDAFQLRVDVEVLWELLQTLPQGSLRGQQVQEGLMAFTRLVDFEQPPQARGESYRRARQALAPLLACHNGSTAPEMWMFGQSHIDLAWLWPLEETYHKVSRTYATQLALMREYPEYRFLACEPALLNMLRAHSPALWQEMRAAVSRGQAMADGAFYVECDTNLPSGESLVRQLLWGKKWFQKELGVQSRVAWQPDTFGFSGALPQLLKGLDVPYFATQKLLRAHPEYPAFPYENFMWEGIDGSCVQAVSFFKCNAEVSPGALTARWQEKRVQQEGIDTQLYPFGYGDGGGGPTRQQVETLRRMGDLEGLPRARYGAPEAYFERVRASAERNRWVGELYLQWHRGVYSVQQRQKALCRRLEEALHNTEMLLCMLPAARRAAWHKTVEEAWQTLLLCQFHDIAAGVGIRRVHREAEQALEARLTEMAQAQRALIGQIGELQQLSGQYTAFNPLPWEVRGFVCLPDGTRVYQRLLPGGMTPVNRDVPQPGDVRAWETENGFVLQNSRLRAEVNPAGQVTSLTDPCTGFAWTEPGACLNDWRLYKQVESVYDAWELSEAYAREEIPHCVRTRVTLVENTPQRAALRVEHTFLHSTAEQTLCLEADSPCLVARNRVCWQERHTLLKVLFATGLLCREALHEIQFGRIARPTHHSNAAARAQYEVCQQRYSAVAEENRGIAVLNDGLYGVSARDGTLALTLLRAPLVPDDQCDRGEHTFTFAVFPFTGRADERVVRAAWALNQPPLVVPGLGRSLPGFACEGAVLDTIKPPEDGGEGAVLRLYEATGSTVEARLLLPRGWHVEECGLDEKGHIPVENPLALRFRPFQIRTFRAQREEQ